MIVGGPGKMTDAHRKTFPPTAFVNLARERKRKENAGKRITYFLS
jgi:hypothetical protein